MAEPIACPFCGAINHLEIETTMATQQWVTDCETCCRPFQVEVEAEPGHVLRLQAHAH